MDYIKLDIKDPHYWPQDLNVTNWLCEEVVHPGMRVLEIGADRVVFPRTTDVADCREVKLPDNVRLSLCNVTRERLPYPDKAFDFCFCRHTIEDLCNPELVLSEMSRVAKAGYIETPSPVAELCRGVDGPKTDGTSTDFRGYHHHHFIVWEHDGVLYLLTKFPLVEHLILAETALVGILRTSSAHWNTYYLWKDEIKFRHLQSTVDYKVTTEYVKLLNAALSQSLNSVNKFWEGCGILEYLERRKRRAS